MSTVFAALKRAERERSAWNNARSTEVQGAEQHATIEPAHLVNGEGQFEQISLESHDDRSAPVFGDRLNARAADEFQVLSTRIRQLVTEQGRRVWAVASAYAGEGKSFVTLNLGVSLARTGHRVILVDADLRTPSLHTAFNLMPLRGLLDYLIRGEDFSACAYQTSVPGLMLVPAGGSTRSGSELFASARLRQFIEDAKASDPDAQIVLDLPPVLATPEAQIISRLTDAILMVVAANRTPRASVTRALSLISGAEVVGAVLNRFEPSYSQRAAYEYYAAPLKRNDRRS